MTSYRLCLGLIIALPIATPADFRNDAKQVFGTFINSECIYLFHFSMHSPRAFNHSPCLQYLVGIMDLLLSSVS